MKLKGNCKQWTVSQSELGRILEISHQRINQLITEEIVLRDESSKSGAVFLIDSMKNYYQSIKSSTEGDVTVNFWKERARHEKAKRELTELKLEQKRGELYEAATVESVLFELITNFRNKITGIPAKVSPQLQGKPLAQINEILTAEIEYNLNELAEEISNLEFEYEDEDRTAEEIGGTNKNPTKNDSK